MSKHETHKGRIHVLLDTVGSVWFGVSMMAALLVYCWIGSAGIPVLSAERFWFVRQEFELTEMEWFAWWPFYTLCALLAISIVLVTLRRIKLNLPNLGVWTVHVGVLTLMLGCVLYFGLKIEGDIAVYRRQAQITVPGAQTAMTLRQGESVELRGDRVSYRLSVADLNPHYELLTGDDKGKKTYSAQLFVEKRADGAAPQQFVRQVLVGYPEYTEDVLPGQGRAIKVTGQRTVDDDLTIELQYAAADRFFVRDQFAVHARWAGETEWTEFPLEDLPRYNEYVPQPGDVLSMPGGESIDSYRPLDIKPAPTEESAARSAADLNFQVTGYVPFAFARETWQPGGSTFDPYVRFSIGEGAQSMSAELLANQPELESTNLGGQVPVSFRWIEKQEELDALINPAPPTITVTVPGQRVTRVIPLAEVMNGEIAIPGTGYVIEGLELYPSWSLASTGQKASMALFQVRSPQRSFRRAVVHPRVELSQDLDESGKRQGGLIDPAIKIELSPVPQTGVVLVGGPVGTHALLVSEGGQVLHEPAAVGQMVSFLDGSLKLTIDEMTPYSERVLKPALIPKRERDLKEIPFRSMIQLRIVQDGVENTMWLPYSHYSFPSRGGYFPLTVNLNGRPLELLYSRQTYPLPAPLALDHFELETYTGRTQERDYISMVRFEEESGWTEPHEVRSNQPTALQGWWFFQSTWDPPQPERNYAGMNYSGIGVGNRHGVWIMLLGSVLAIFGTFYAFYIKPIILRRRRDMSRAKAEARKAAAGRPAEPVVPAAARGATARVGETP